MLQQDAEHKERLPPHHLLPKVGDVLCINLARSLHHNFDISAAFCVTLRLLKVSCSCKVSSVLLQAPTWLELLGFSFQGLCLICSLN